MTIDFECLNCGLQLHAPNEYAGGKARCRKCGTEVRIPGNQVAIPNETDDLNALPTISDVSTPMLEDTITVACPKCRREFPVSLLGHAPDDKLLVACDHCGFEKGLKSFKREFQRQRWEQERQRQALAEEHQEAAARGKEAYWAGLSPPTLPDEIPSGGIATNGRIEFEGYYTPDVSLLRTEKVLDTFEAGVWDLGLFGWLLGHKWRIVLTSHRVFCFKKKTIDNLLEVVWLRRIKAVTVGQELKALQLLFGVALLMASMALVLLNPVIAILNGCIALLAIVFSRRKVLAVSAGDDKVGLKLARIRSDESRRFMDKVFAALSEAESGENQASR